MPVATIEEIQVRGQDDRTGAIVSFPYDASLVERFRARFPRARWHDDSQTWFVPGTTAERRVGLWLQHELSEPMAFADERGRDAFAFDPIESQYLEANDDLIVRTPYSRIVIEELRAIPWAAWDAGERAWRVPYRSLEALRERWLTIEIAARRAEPGERKRRREELKRSPEFAAIKELATERRRKRLPLPSSALPPIGRPVMTAIGIVSVTGSDGEIADLATVATYPVSNTMGDYVWVFWRSPTLDELVRTWPARRASNEKEQARGWWLPTLAELRVARRKARSIERAAATRAARTV
ncbi:MULTISPECIES: hypothetical protein [unclassified Bosea (in: a-proteobacteria)]|uniref:hypothetical protein n=1 Tax=unclassified Bosea (in: a-proteobacteria) TaxID=2653178 RepID=UPI000F757FD2|nr:MULTISPECIES: hypothetical protein [unclassified Bosea (in: a-proteobacteria)]AZO82164.1 hypothetical protein BLM15_30785 [Bosea sp. Tri-49]RXT20731.1 hypothetical protein B5U98_18265 [Bosea sp. Tri-39]RXT33721.1 hypothetical protein B5U99_18190 [Bosea sp. Tri-54]